MTIKQLHQVGEDQVSTEIASLLFSEKKINWKKIESVLDLHIPKLIEDIQTAPAYQFIFKEKKIDPTTIQSFESFNKIMPVITPELYYRVINSSFEGKKIGVNGFTPQTGVASPIYNFQDSGNQHTLLKGNTQITTILTPEDVTASAIGFAAHLNKHNAYIHSSIVKNVESSFVSDILDQAKLYFASINQSNTETMSQADINKPNTHWGLFPSHINSKIIPFPNLLYTVDKSGYHTFDDGTFVINNFFSISEDPFGTYTFLKQIVESLLNRREFQLNGKTETTIGSFCMKLLEELHGGSIKDKLDLLLVYKKVIKNWLCTDVKWNSPRGSIFLKFGIPTVGSISKDGSITHFEHVPKTTTLSDGEVFLYRHGFHPVLYQPEYIKNLVDGKSLDSPLAVRVFDVTDGKHSTHFSEGKAYLYSQPAILRKQLDHAIVQAKKNANIPRKKIPTITEICNCLRELQKKIREDEEFQTLYSRKSGIPLSEVEEMVDQLESFISESNLKKLVYYSLNGYSDSDTQAHDKSVDDLTKKVPLSPFYIVTAGNLNFLDWFKILAELLLSSLGNRSPVFIIRPSESDLVSSYCLYHFQDALNNTVADIEEKGLHKMFQRLFWNPNIHPEYGVQLLSECEGSISFGTLQSFMTVRSKACLSVLQKSSLPEEEVHNLYKHAGISFEKNVKGVTYESLKKSYNEHKISKEAYSIAKDYFDKNILYRETLNAAIVCQDIAPDKIDTIATEILNKAYKLRGTDCLSLKNVYVHTKHASTIYEALKEKASQLIAGDPFNRSTELATYDPAILSKLKSSLKNVTSAEVVTPRSITGEHGKKAIQQDVGITGVTFLRKGIEDPYCTTNTAIKQDDLADESVHTPYPLLRIIEFDDTDQLIRKLNLSIAQHAKQSNYPRYTFIGVFTQKEFKDMKSKLIPIADILKENNLEFNPLEPHNKRYFLRDVLGEGLLS